MDRTGQVASAFVAARAAAQGLAQWPGALPATLEEAYALQRQTQLLWDEAAGGVKVGRVLNEWTQRLGVDRFIGPVDSTAIRIAPDAGEAIFPVISGGTALLECEIVVVLGTDAPDGTALGGAPLSVEAALKLIGGMNIGIEVAGSPMVDINTLGPLASIACFGNNNGAIVGRDIRDWRHLDLTSLACTAWIDGAIVGQGDTARLPGGIGAALAFACTQAARISAPLRRGDIVCTGALTGMHPIAAGQRAKVDFGALGSIQCIAVEQGARGKTKQDGKCTGW